MSEYLSRYPNVEVSGAAIMSILVGLGDRVQPLVQKHLGALSEVNWYLEQGFLNMLKEISTDPTYDKLYDMVSVGMKIPETAHFPEHINDLESALLALDEFYHLNHRNDSESGWKVRQVEPGHIVCVSSTPYPSDLEYGMLYSLARRFCPKGVSFSVKLDEREPSRKRGGSTCMYHVEWK